MKNFLEQEKIPYKSSVPIHSLTHMSQQGTLPLVVYPQNRDHLLKLCKEIYQRELTFEFLGGLTNTYLCDFFTRDIVIVTNGVKDICKADTTISVDCGFNLTHLSKQLVEYGVKGYEGLIGIPGTVGAACINNSGAFGCEMSEVVIGCECFSFHDGKLHYFSKDDLQFSTRSSILKRNKTYCLLCVELNISQKGDKNQLSEIASQNINRRKLLIDGKRKSLGTVFVATTMKELYKKHKIALFFWKILNLPNKLFFGRSDWSLFLQFWCLGHPELAKHCDSLGRFCWDKDTTEKDFMQYLQTMQTLANGKLKYEIDIKK